MEEVKKRFNGAVSCHQGNNFDPHLLNRLTVVNSTSLRQDKIACIIASYNYGRYLIEAIESVLRQTILPNEILITDDCSDDETQEIAEFYMANHPDLISYNRNSENMGVVDHFNKAISLVSSEYIFFLGADNRILSNYIEETSKILDSNKNIAIAYTDYAFFGARARLKYETLTEDRKGGIVDGTYFQVNFGEYNTKSELLNSLKKSNFIHGSSMFKKKSFAEVGGYLKTDLPEDYNLFLRIIEKGWSAKKAAKTNLEYRQHSIGQANDVLSLQNKMLFYKNSALSAQKKYVKLSKNKSKFENSYLFKVSFFLFRTLSFLRKNSLSPKKIIKKTYSLFSK
ncbi:glycosyltransferase family 2 protein [Salinimicrobium sp. CDJ15-91]|uniref:Glycosyltransferase family 2 protein n=1 Tax=Salinimicrobium oceani TaxID=2722702 RepID=A0ABX1CZH0_9FLAO|nr:glycosyltransferase family 2 protein [Salinimicrobium oceani]